MYPDAATVHSEWVKYAAMKDIFYEFMFLIAVLIPLFKRTRLSKAILISSLILILGSITDKLLQEVTTYHIHDTVLILGAVFVGQLVYFKSRD